LYDIYIKLYLCVVYVCARARTHTHTHTHTQIIIKVISVCILEGNNYAYK